MLCLEQPSIRVNRIRLATRFSIRFKRSCGSLLRCPISPSAYLQSPHEVRAAFPGYRNFYSSRLAQLRVLSDGFELSSLRHNVHLDVTPKRDQELARQGNNPNLTHPPAAERQTFGVPQTQITLRLQPKPVPSQLYRVSPYIADAVLTDALLFGGLPALVGGGHKPTQGCKFSTVSNLTPAKKFHRIEPSTIEPHAPKGHEFSDLLDTWLFRVSYSVLPLGQKLFDLQPNDLQPLIFMSQMLYHSTAKRRAVPESDFFKPLKKSLATRCQQNALGCQKPFDPIDLAGPFGFQTHQLSVKLPAIFFLHARRMHDTQNLLLAPAIANQHRQKLSHIQMISFRAACPTIDFNARRIHHVIVHPDVQQKPVKPKAIRPSLVAAHHLRRPGQPKALLSSLNLLPEPLSVSSSNCDLARLLPHTNGRPDLPFRFSQFERNVENLLLNCDSLSFAGRCCFHLTPPLLWFVVLRSLTASARFFHSISPASRGRSRGGLNDLNARKSS